MEFYVRQNHSFNNDQIEEIAANVKETFLENVMDCIKVYNIHLIDKKDLKYLLGIVLDRINFYED